MKSRQLFRSQFFVQFYGTDVLRKFLSALKSQGGIGVYLIADNFEML